jgi:DNA-directed RNA polymerase subunit H (RpoH/RPB5)
MNIKDQLIQTWKTVVEMLMDRDILDENEKQILKSIGHKELETLYKDKNRNIFNIDIHNRIRIIYYVTKFKIADFRQFIENTDFEMYIVIMQDKLTTNNLKSIMEFEKKIEKQHTMQFFELKELMFNITHHSLVPKHTVIRDEVEIEEIVKKYNLKSKLHLPLLLRTDPISRYYDIKSGQLVKIERISPSSGEYVVYRCCV